MPRTKPTEFEQYQMEVRALIKKHMELNKIHVNCELAKKIGMPESTFNERMRHPEKFKLEEMHRIRMCLHIPENERGIAI